MLANESFARTKLRVRGADDPKLGGCRGALHAHEGKVNAVNGLEEELWVSVSNHSATSPPGSRSAIHRPLLRTTGFTLVELLVTIAVTTTAKRATGANTRFGNALPMSRSFGPAGYCQRSEVRCHRQLIDMYPTLVDLCVLPVPRQKLEGESLTGTLADPKSAQDRNVVLPHMNPGEYAVINRD